jgi:hypothetical protein
VPKRSAFSGNLRPHNTMSVPRTTSIREVSVDDGRSLGMFLLALGITKRGEPNLRDYNRGKASD